MKKITITSVTLKKELGETKIWTVKFTDGGPEKNGEIISKTEPPKGETETEAVEWQEQYQTWKIKLARKNGANGYKGKTVEERAEMARMNSLNHAVKLLCDHPEVKEQIKSRSVRDAVFTTAKQFEDYILTGKVPTN